MPRRKSNQSGISQFTLFLIIVAVLAGIYIYWRYPNVAAQITEPLLGTPTSLPARPTANVLVPTPQFSPTAQAVPTNQNGIRTSWYELFFTTPRYPDLREYHSGGIDTQLVGFIDTAVSTIDLAAYDFDLENVATALARAAGRGVRVRMVTDTDTLTNPNKQIQRAFTILKRAKIPIVDDQRPALMHNKFAVVDNAAILTGSWNFTDGDTYRLNNNAILLKVPELAQNYTLEFEQMFVGRKFGGNKSPINRHPVVQIGTSRIENYFAPEDKVAARISARLKQATQSIHFLAFSFTSDEIGNAIEQMAKAGVQVAGVFETTGSNTQFSEYGKLLKLKLDVLQDGNPYVMHHKVIIIDGKTVIFGSYNFTNNAEKDNDENVLIFDDPQLAQAFEAEFQRVREVALHPLKPK